jgi:hypothetical protein
MAGNRQKIGVNNASFCFGQQQKTLNAMHSSTGKGAFVWRKSRSVQTIPIHNYSLGEESWNMSKH